VRRLAIRPGALGDFIVSLPALECLKGDYLEVWSPSAHLPLINFADSTQSIASTGLNLVGVTDPPARLWERLRGFDSILSWYGSNRAEFQEAVSHLPFTFFAALPGNGNRLPYGRGSESGGPVHAVDFYLSQVRTLQACDSDGIPRIRCETTEAEFVVIHPFSGSPRKNWPLENFHALAEQLSATSKVYWCRGPEDPPLEGAVEIENLRELANWIAGARLFIGNDSGVSHLAAAVGTPVLAFFGPASNPEVWAPRGPHVQIGHFDLIVP
jgi:heptosyltransferase-3